MPQPKDERASLTFLSVQTLDSRCIAGILHMELADGLSRRSIQSFLDFRHAKAQNLRTMEGVKDVLEPFSNGYQVPHAQCWSQ